MIRYEYNSEMEKLFIRCPSSQHEHIVSDLTIKIANEAKYRSTDPEASQYARNFWDQLLSSQSSNVNLTDRQGNRSIFQPDVSFIPKAAKTPSFITEIAYSQIEKDLAKRAEAYIRNSHGDVSTVMGIKIQYPEAKNASLTIWKANFRMDGNKNVLTTDQVLGPLVYPPDTVSSVSHRFVGQSLIGL
jgi:2-oxoglutarate dehydrogenase complex dehydrogenase (E1) component-like enzyme